MFCCDYSLVSFGLFVSLEWSRLGLYHTTPSKEHYDVVWRKKRNLSWIPFRPSGQQLMIETCWGSLKVLMLPRFQFSIHLITLALLSSMLLRVTVAWLYIKPAVACRPTGDPVDSDPTVVASNSWADGLILEGLSYPCKTLTVFTHLACSGVFRVTPLGVGCRLLTT